MDTEVAPNVAVVIPAKDEVDRISATIRSARAIPHADLIVVVDDGSDDDTQNVARAAGATVVRHPVNRGKASAMQTGARVVAMRDAKGRTPRLLLFIDADLGESAVGCVNLVDPVLSGAVDCTIAALPRQAGAGGHGLVTGLARKAISTMTGWSPVQPLSGQRCMTREAYESALPLARGWGVETAMTIDMLVAGYTLQEIPCDLHHRATTNDFSGQVHRAKQYRDVVLAVNYRRLRGVKVPTNARVDTTDYRAGEPFNAYRVRPLRGV